MITAGINFAIVTGRLEDRRGSVEGRDETSDREAEEDWRGIAAPQDDQVDFAVTRLSTTGISSRSIVILSTYSELLKGFNTIGLKLEAG